jgi:prepilin-type N-terminal cleavage/methylation domain-containing protein
VTRAVRPRQPFFARASSAHGFSLIELLTAIVIMLVITGAIFALVDPSRGTARAQVEVSDQQQRMRVAADTITKDLLMAGAGTYSGSASGSLAHFFSPVLPYANGALFSGWGQPAPRFRDDQITIMYVPNTAAQTSVDALMPQPSSEIKVTGQAGCPVDPVTRKEDPLCGFYEGMNAIIFDDTGSWDVFTVTEVQEDAQEGGHLQHRPPNPDFSKAYAPGAHIAQVQMHTYLLDANRRELQHYDGWTNPPVAVTNNTVGFRVQYFGEPNPQLLPRPEEGQANCVFDAAGNAKLPALPSPGGSLVELTPAILTDGPLCGSAPNQFDADLFRLRKVRITLRMQVAAQDLRGTGEWFAAPGTSQGGTRFAPDYTMSFEITPRNLNLMR